MTIDELLLKYKTDKNHGTIKNIYNNLDDRIVIDNPEPCIGHTYGKSYDEIFENYDKDGPINLLEIGIQKGGSMLAWKDYFKNGNIYGVDIIDCILPEYRSDSLTYIFSDIRSPETKEQLKDIKFDIIIDDGSHHLNDVMFVIHTYLEQLNTNGVLIIEDCQDPGYWLHQITNITPIGYEVTTRDLREGGYSYDNFLIVIKKL